MISDCHNMRLCAAFVSGIQAQQEAYIDSDLAAFSGSQATPDVNDTPPEPLSPASSVTSVDSRVSFEQPSPPSYDVPTQHTTAFPEGIQNVQHEWAPPMSADSFRKAWYWYMRATTNVATLASLGIEGVAGDPFSGCSFCAQLPQGMSQKL